MMMNEWHLFLLGKARLVLEAPIASDVDAWRAEIVRRESLCEQLRRARLRGQERRVARLERAIVVGGAAQ